MARYISCTETAKLIRASLKEHFKGVKFSVRSSSYAGGASIHISWSDGPCTPDVDRVVKHFQGASFDGMTDSTTYHTGELNGEEVHFGSDYVSTSRQMSRAFVEAIAAQFCKRFGLPSDAIKVSGSDDLNVWADTRNLDNSHEHWFNDLLRNTDVKDMHRAYEAEEERKERQQAAWEAEEKARVEKAAKARADAKAKAEREAKEREQAEFARWQKEQLHNEAWQREQFKKWQSEQERLAREEVKRQAEEKAQREQEERARRQREQQQRERISAQNRSILATKASALAYLGLTLIGRSRVDALTRNEIEEQGRTVYESIAQDREVIHRYPYMKDVYERIIRHKESYLTAFD